MSGFTARQAGWYRYGLTPTEVDTISTIAFDTIEEIYVKMSEHAGWVEVGLGRWTWADLGASEARHLLLRAGDVTADRVFVELHGTTLHRYDEVGDNGLVNVDCRLLLGVDLTHRDSIVDESIAELSDDEAWARMVEHGRHGPE